MINHRRRALTISAAVAIFAAAVFVGALTVDAMQDNSYGWEKASPESHGMSTDHLNFLLEDLKQRDTSAFLVVKNDRIIYEWYRNGKYGMNVKSNARTLVREVVPSKGYSHQQHNLGAMIKTLVSGMAVMLAVEDGIVGLDDPAWMYIPEWRDDPSRSQITLRHLVTQTSGIENVRFPHEQEGWKGEFSRDAQARFPLSMTTAPVVAAPGTEYVYSSTGFYALHYALAVAMKDEHPDLAEYLDLRFMGPLGIPREEWGLRVSEASRIDDMTVYPPAGSYTARAAARVGQLFLHSGNWQGRQIADPDLVTTMISYAAGPDLVRPEGTPGPSIGGWTNFDGLWPSLPPDAVVAAGANHKMMLIVPSLDLVVVRFGGPLTGADVWTEEGASYFEGLERHIFGPIMDAMLEVSSDAD